MLRSRHNSILNLLCAICMVAFSHEAFAAGFAIPHQTARGLALSNAFTAGVNDPSAAYYNPAALGEIRGNAVLATGTYVGLYNSVENSGRDAVNKHDDNFLASIFANYHIPGSDFTVGIGTYSPFGLATTYERDFTRFAAENRAENYLCYARGILASFYIFFSRYRTELCSWVGTIF